MPEGFNEESSAGIVVNVAVLQILQYFYGRIKNYTFLP